MDVTPQLLQDIEFREKVRGYHPDDVDDFLERVGVAFSELVDRLRQANDRAEAAETALAERAEVDESTLSRTLVLAQRTADAAIAEAKAEAELTLSEATTEAERLVTEAKAEAETMVSTARSERNELVRAAEAEARAEAAAVTGPIEEEIARLEARRGAIMEQSGGLEAWLAAQREKLSSVATDLQGILDDPDRLRPDPAPVVPDSPGTEDATAPTTGLTLVDVDADADDDSVSEVEVDAPVESAPSVVSTEPSGGDAAVDGPEDVLDEVIGADAEGDDGVQPELGLTPEAEVPRGVDTETDDGGSESDDEPEAKDDALVVDIDAVESGDLDDRPSRVSVVRSAVQSDGSEVVDEPTGTSDSFLEELRRAVEAPTDLVESEEDRALSAFFEHEDEEPKRRFGRRR